MQEFRTVHNKIFDGLRAISILLVIFFHINYLLVRILPPDGVQQYIDSSPAILNISWHALGSEIIFFLSGYLLTYILLMEINESGRINFNNYFIKRAARILPLYYLALGVFAISGSFGVLSGTYNLQEWIYNLLFISKILDGKTIIPVGWSLELQVQFYLLLPFLLMLGLKLKQPVLLFLFLIISSVTLRYIMMIDDPVFATTKFHAVLLGADASTIQIRSYHLIHYRMSALALGMLFAYMIITYREQITRYLQNRIISYGVVFSGLVLIIFFGFLPIHNKDSFFYTLFDDQWYVFYMATNRLFFIIGLTLVLAKLILSAGRLHILSYALGNRVFGIISRSIYPIYLFHALFMLIAMVIVYQTTDKDNVTSVSALQLVELLFLTVLFSTVASYAIHKYIELPCQKIIRGKFLNKH